MAATIGEQLRLAREGRGIPLREISDQTRISMHYLEAIESNDYKRLPGGIFNRSFVKAYAKYVGYDEKEAVEGYARYMRDAGEHADDVVTTPLQSKVYTNIPATRSPLLTVVLAIVILAVLTAIALGVLQWVQHRSAIASRSFTIAAKKSDALHHENLSSRRAAAGKTEKADYEQVWQ
ncbi:MAG TPA: helix-turn-helix domain-containing protein [Pyrinomonadaceae bacterium]|nr:helix-turn-helix domain-containing protein [Pyrinomonadaceae bacterium]